MRKWFIAIYLFSSHKKGISSHQLSRDLSITQKTAWFMLQRIREVMKNDNNNSKSGTFEADEAYIGDSESNKYTNKKNKIDKVCVFGMVNRNTKRVKAYKINTNSIEGFGYQGTNLLCHLQFHVFWQNRELIGGLKWTYEPSVLRFFVGKLAPIGDWQDKLVAKFKADFGESL